jgi:hypothetical protein
MHTEPLLTAKGGVRAAWGVSKGLVTFTMLDIVEGITVDAERLATHRE